MTSVADEAEPKVRLNLQTSSFEFVSQTKPKIVSLADAAERKIFETLTEQIGTLGEASVYVVGGSIPITSLEKHLICESDGSVTGTEASVSVSVSNLSHQSDDQEDENHEAENDADHDAEQEAEHEQDDEDHEHNDEEDDPDEEDTGEKNDEEENDSHAMRCDPITIRWDSTSQYNKLTMPIREDERSNFEQLLKDCQPASFGIQGVEVMDQRYRKAGKFDETSFCTNFNPYSLDIVNTAKRALAPNHWLENPMFGIRAELYKLNVYSAPSGMFKSHVDTPRSRHQLGSLVVCLPNVHEGGQLVVRHEGRETVFDWSGEQGRNAIQWAAFYGDCEHEVLEVTAGHRITLTYNLFVTCPMNKAPIDPKKLELFDTLNTVLTQPQFCKKGIVLGYHCVHSYPHEVDRVSKAFPSIFKGADKLVYECFQAMNMKLRIRACVQDEYYAKFHDDEEIHVEDDERPENPHPIQNPDQDGDITYLATGLPGFSLLEYGFDESSYLPGMLEQWDKMYIRQNIKWLNESTEKRLAIVHPTYGNQPSVGTVYSRLVIILEVPPFNER